MKRHALLWCGWSDPRGRFDFPASVRDLDMAVRGARALGIRDEDIHAFVCRDDLLPQDFRASRQYPATVEDLSRVTQVLARHGSPDDALLFVATNHGERKGLLTSTPVDEFDEEPAPRLLTPAELGRCLDPLPGQQVLALATCHAGSFLSLGRVDRRAVLAACTEDQKYIVQSTPPCSPFLLEFFQTWCGVGLEEESRPPLATDLAVAFAQAEQRLTREYGPEYKALKPLLQGMACWPR